MTDSADASAGESVQHVEATERIEAAPDAVFAFLANPANHKDTEPTDWVGEAIDPAPIEQVGDVFGMHMYSERVGGAYTMHNEVTVFEPNRAIAWKPGKDFGDDGRLQTGGWVYRYDIEPVEGGSEVTLSYDWSEVPEQLAQKITFPPFGPDHLAQSLRTLASAL